ETKIGLDSTQRKGVIALLEALLADEHVLYIKTRNFHWNVMGPRFHDLHLFFESQYDAVEDKIDEVAERIRSLGGPAPGSMSAYLGSARLKEHTGAVPSADAMIEQLLQDHEATIVQLRTDLATAADKFGDAGTCDFLTGLMED